MILNSIKNRFVKTLVILLIASQLAVSFNFILVPKKAEAGLGSGSVVFSFDSLMVNWAQAIKDIALGIAERLAISYANKYLQQFVDKLIDKYRIKDYLAYDKVLSGYYLNQYIYQNVEDPDLRAIYGLLARELNSSVQVKNNKTGERQVLLAQLRRKIDDIYYGQGGIDRNIIYGRGSARNDEQYFAAAAAYFASPPDFTQQQVIGEFGQIQSSAAAAAQREIAQSQGFKNDRSAPAGIVPHYCSRNNTPPPTPGGESPEPAPEDGFGMIGNFLASTGIVHKAFAELESKPIPSIPAPLPKGPTPNINPSGNQTDCESVGGQWKVDAHGMANSFIQNPSAFIHDFSTNAIQSVFTNNFKMGNNIYSAIGSLLGNFIFTKLNLDSNKAGSTLNEKGPAYQKNDGFGVTVKEVDLDGDGIPEGQDNDKDGKLETFGVDSCYHGYNRENQTECKWSGDQTGPATTYFVSICRALENAVAALTQYQKFLEDHKGEVRFTANGFFQPDKDRLINPLDADFWGGRTGEVKAAADAIVGSAQRYRIDFLNELEKQSSGYSRYLNKMIQAIEKDEDLAFDNFGNGAGGLANLVKYNDKMLEWYKKMQTAIKSCSDPDLEAAGNVPPPVGLPVIEPNEEEGAPPPADAETKHGNHAGEVAAAKAQLAAQGMTWDPSTQSAADYECNRFAIVNLAAQLIGAGAGLLSKPGGNNCQGYSVDRIAFPDGYIYDVLDGTAPDGAGPAWSPDGCGPVDGDGTCADRYRPPI